MTRRLAYAALLLLLFATRASATNSCSAYASGIVFGSYFGSVVNVTGTVTVTCTNGQAYDVALNAGLASGATVTARSMTNGSAELGYKLFSNSARTTNWGNSSSTGWVAGTGTGSAQTYIIYAQIPASETGALESYTDTITASASGTGITTATAEFSVTATIVKDCTVSATSLAFGNYTGALNSTTSTISAKCTSGTAYTVGLSAGLATGATVTNRSMTGPGSALLKYDLYSNSGHTTNWGNTSATNWVSGTGNGSTQNLTVYGQIPAAQYVTPGSYTDTITVSVTY
ncbi:MAG TPA: spore coat U domain-containing protein [Terracidiphilus sp.]|jgi:spore coat protein U-like protein